MASTPSASALSAVLRCRGNIWTRNPPTKRPAASAYSLGLSAGALRDSAAERTGAPQSSAWEAVPRGVAVGGRLAVAYRVGVKIPGETDSREVNQFCFPKLSQPPGDAHSAPPGVQHGQLARRLTRSLPGAGKRSKITHAIQDGARAAHVCRITVAEDRRARALRLAVTCPCSVTGQIPSLVSSGCSSLSRTCLSVTALLSELVWWKLAVLCGSSSGPPDAQQQLLDEDDVGKNGQQAHGHIQSSCQDTSGPHMTEDRPD
ncbi:uncharacterized protein LOC103356803 [Stegastes partitus]|uniref:Uncharacterized protein LOC103356803 n=1 Tax=Stegastes partitus TaxID=144197 RepID=A0A9Y4JQG2_9TELE|nr:PREDICTED: uncharacterized protein LOC103356803 [Stegastes partitus]XP_008279320.1 PREDICTED: uncharacterized protein LOC103356803 [Stegastes partitus]